MDKKRLLGIGVLLVTAVVGWHYRHTLYNALQGKYSAHKAGYCSLMHLNPDEKSVPLYAAQFSKGLEHDTTTGLLTPEGQKQYRHLVAALDTGKTADFELIKRAPQAIRQFACPTYVPKGCDDTIKPLIAPPPFSITDQEGAANLIENYWMALCRDVHFADYGTGKGTDASAYGGSLTADAAAVLTDFGRYYTGPPTTNQHTVAQHLFRGNFPGVLIGPYISQFLYASTYRFGIQELKQLVPISPAQDFGVTWADFIALQNGRVPHIDKKESVGQYRYIMCGRDLAVMGHNNDLYETPCAALNILRKHGFPLSPSIKAHNKGISSCGIDDIDVWLAFIAKKAEEVSWLSKWYAYRVLRPEAFAGLVHRAKITGINPCHIHDTLFMAHAGIDTLERVQEYNRQQIRFDTTLSNDEVATYLLPQVYEEGSPLHPSYQSQHAIISGACITVLKAFFDDTVLIKEYMVPRRPDPDDVNQLIPLYNEGEDSMTVGSELDKLASNMAMARNFAGIHYRQDADKGMVFGEQLAVSWLQELLASRREFADFTLTTITGQRIRVTAAGIQTLS